MSDARWLDVEDDVAAAARHFANAVALHGDGGFDEPGLAGYRNGMALMHALQSAHTSAEMALGRVLLILGEERPEGDDWHQKLILRAARPIAGPKERPAILSSEVAGDLDETRRFRNRATRSYGAFDVGRIRPTIEAAARLRDVACTRRRAVSAGCRSGRLMTNLLDRSMAELGFSRAGVAMRHGPARLYTVGDAAVRSGCRAATARFFESALDDAEATPRHRATTRTKPRVAERRQNRDPASSRGDIPTTQVIARGIKLFQIKALT